MKIKTRLLASILLLTSFTMAQETRRTAVNASSNPADDSRENSNKVPDVFAVSGHFDRIVVLRFKYKADLLAGLQKMIAQEHIQNGVILSAIGSVRGYQIHQVSNRTFPSHDTYVKNPSEPADIVSMNGYVLAGKVHPHLTLATPDKVIAGHLEPGTQVFTFAIVTIGVMNGTDLNRFDDKAYR
ncbi:MAG TPA: PPC domain-containing DNA-binding protein [Acidobacteriaceae bacterium]|nr:PPC domain-containing DNA-binding protein [Acidobacteriaceae bacterium]